MNSEMKIKFQELEEKIDNLICLAFDGGNSVIEIQRCLSYKTAERIYRLLRTRGKIPHVKKRPGVEIPKKLEICLAYTKLSFLTWCNSWEFDPVKAAEVLKSVPEAENAFGWKVHSAVQRDFCNVYAELYQGAEVIAKYANESSGIHKSKLSFRCVYEEDGCRYRCYIEEDSSIYGLGDRWDDAFRQMKLTYNLYRRLFKLGKLLEHGTDWRHWTECPTPE